MDTQRKQVDKSAYNFQRYCGLDRWSSYHYQISELLRAVSVDNSPRRGEIGQARSATQAKGPHAVLEVGVGDGVVANYIKRNTDIMYSTVDIADDVDADVIGSVTALPFQDKSFDIACAFEVLEHLPFETIDTSLSELARVARKRVIISVPHFGPSVRLRFKLPFLKEISVAWKFPVPFQHEFNGQHYWELGKRGYPPRRLRTRLEKFFLIENEYVPFENQYHHFFVLTPKA